jgi:tripartite-type tricarboxylate transporter receptor subunit TctC
MRAGPTKLSRRIPSLILLAALGVHAGAALAQSYPTRPIRIVVPSTAGGALDIGARIIAPKMSDALNQPVIVENRPGAAGRMAQGIVAEAPPDGYTILLDAPNLAINPALYRKMPFDAANDFTPVTQLVATQLVIVASPRSQITSVKEAIAQAKSKPGSLNYGHMGVGSTLHLIMELLKISTGADILGIPYKGDALIAAALMSGEVELAIVPLPSNLASIRAGRLRALAVTGSTRSAVIPDVPTITEAGVGFEFVGWWGLFVPAKTPRAVVDVIHREAVNALNAPDIRSRLLAMGQEVLGTTPEEFAAKYRENLAQFARIVREGRIPLQD